MRARAVKKADAARTRILPSTSLAFEQQLEREREREESQRAEIRLKKSRASRRRDLFAKKVPESCDESVEKWRETARLVRARRREVCAKIVSTYSRRSCCIKTPRGSPTGPPRSSTATCDPPTLDESRDKNLVTKCRFRSPCAKTDFRDSRLQLPRTAKSTVRKPSKYRRSDAEKTPPVCTRATGPRPRPRTYGEVYV